MAFGVVRLDGLDSLASVDVKEEVDYWVILNVLRVLVDCDVASLVGIDFTEHNIDYPLLQLLSTYGVVLLFFQKFGQNKVIHKLVFLFELFLLQLDQVLQHWQRLPLFFRLF